MACGAQLLKQPGLPTCGVFTTKPCVVEAVLIWGLRYLQLNLILMEINTCNVSGARGRTGL